eukprot:58059-Rhodomonas_salina.1
MGHGGNSTRDRGRRFVSTGEGAAHSWGGAMPRKEIAQKTRGRKRDASHGDLAAGAHDEGMPRATIARCAKDEHHRHPSDGQHRTAHGSERRRGQNLLLTDILRQHRDVCAVMVPCASQRQCRQNWRCCRVQPRQCLQKRMLDSLSRASASKNGREPAKHGHRPASLSLDGCMRHSTLLPSFP